MRCGFEKKSRPVRLVHAIIEGAAAGVFCFLHAGSATGEASANQTYGAYLALVYAAAIFGGYVADRRIGYQRSILPGANPVM